jgi:molybdenum cofactor cytidylyltransferase
LSDPLSDPASNPLSKSAGPCASEGPLTARTPRSPVAGLLLAGGRGSRFDATGAANKLLALLDGKPVIWHSAKRLLEATGRLLVVTRPGYEGVAQALTDVQATVLECPDATLGMGHTLAFGVSRLRASQALPSAILVGLADMPCVAPETLNRLVAAANNDQVIAVPRWRGERGHPVLFGRAHFAALEALSGDRGAASLLREHPVHWVEVEDPGILQDIDRPADLAQAQGRGAGLRST